MGRIWKYLMKAVRCGTSRPYDHQRWSVNLAQQPAEQRVPQTPGMGALHEFQFAAAFRLHPHALPHLLGSEAVT